MFSDANKASSAKSKPNPAAVAIPDLSNKTMDQKIDVLISLAQNQNRSMSSLQSEISVIRNDTQTYKDDLKKLSSIQQENILLKHHLLSTQGKLEKLQDKELKLELKIDSIEQRSLQKNLLFLNVPENPNQTPTSLAQVMYDVLATHMSIPVPAIFSQQYPAAEIRIDSVFRLGKFNPSNQNPRPVAVKFLTKLGRDLIFSKTYL